MLVQMYKNGTIPVKVGAGRVAEMVEKGWTKEPVDAKKSAPAKKEVVTEEKPAEVKQGEEKAAVAAPVRKVGRPPQK